MKYYAYCLIDPRDDSIFYVGKGQDQRMFAHVKIVSNGGITNNNSKLTNKIKSLLNENYRIKHRKIYETDNENDAFKKEVEEIARIGLENLCNLTCGGEGIKYTEEMRKKIRIQYKINTNMGMRGKHHSEETKKKIGKSHRGMEYKSKGN